MSDPFSKNTAISAAEAAKIVPRAEFRVFGQGIISAVQARMWEAGAVLQKARRMPEEPYFLSRLTDAANVKVRDGLLDVKLKTGDTPEGYDIFQPAGKFQFPVSRADLKAICGYLRVDIAQRQVLLQGQPVRLSRKEFDLLRVLMSYRGRIVTQRQLLTEVWGKAHLEDTHYLRILMARLRTRLADDPASPRYLETEPGVGYRFLG